MIFNIDRKIFIDALTIGGALSNKKHTMPILECAKIKVNERQVVVSSSDGDMYVTKRAFLISSDGSSEFCVNTSDLMKALRSISEDNVTMQIEDNKIKISHRYGSMKMPYLNADEFPLIVPPSEEKKVSVNAPWFVDVVNKGKNFICHEKGKSISGLHVYSRDRNFGICCADVDKMFIDSIQPNGESDEFSAVIPTSSIQYILSTIGDSEEVSIVFDGNNITFKVPNARICCRLMDVKFPPFEMVIPKNNNSKIIADMGILTGSVNRARMFADAMRRNMITLNISEGNMDISAKDYANAKEGKESVEIAKVGSDIEISFNGNILALCLSSIDCAKAIIRYQDNEHGVIFDDIENENRIVLQMPIVNK